MDWIDEITDRLSHLGDNSTRTMFGGRSFYLRGVIFAIAHRKRL
jgi:TfoX/Sxy family transcriptional regulator of competence genes